MTIIDNLKRLKNHRSAMIGAGVLLFLYFTMIFAEFIAPYHYDSEDRSHSYAPPTQLHFIDHQGTFHLMPVFYERSYAFDEYYRRIFVDDTTKMYQLRFFPKGEKVKLWGIIPIQHHLFGSDEGRFYLVGADSRGRDLFSRIIYGSRVSLTIGFVGVLIATFVGLMIGGMAGYFGGAIDNILMRICEMIMLIPGFYLLLALRAAFPPELSSVSIYFMIVFILSFISWAGIARVIRGMTKSVREREFVLAAEAIGQRRVVIIFRHILPQTLSYLIVSLTLAIPSFILTESGLSLIGLGIQDPHASWGNLLSDAMNIADIHQHPWVLIPGVCIFITVMAYNFLGDGLRDIFDPRSTQQ